MEKENLDLSIGQIYIIKNTQNEKVYIGQTKKYIKKNNQKIQPYGYLNRFKAHCSNTLNYQKFGRCRALNSAMHKYGVSEFKVELLEECLISDLDEKEKYYIKLYNSVSPGGYNLESGGNKQKWISDETKKIQSEKRKIFNQTERGKELIQKNSKITSEKNIINNDIKKIKKFIDYDIKKILISDSINEKIIYFQIYIKDQSKRHKFRLKYKKNVEEIQNRIQNIINQLSPKTETITTCQNLQKLNLLIKQDHRIAGTS